MSLKKDKVVIYFSGGTMQGVFGAGVGRALEELNIYDKIEAVYGASAGVFTGVYFLTNQLDKCSCIYWEDLPRNFIFIKNAIPSFVDRIINRFIKKLPAEKIRNTIDINFLVEACKTKKILDVDTLIRQPIPIYAKLFNLDKGVIEYKDLKRPELFEVMKASICVLPYVHDPVIIDDTRYIDGAIMDVIGIDHIRKHHPHHKIVVVFSNPIRRKFRYKLKNIIEGRVTSFMLKDEKIYDWYAQAEDKLRQEIEICRKDDNIFIVHPPMDFSVLSGTTNQRTLIAGYNMGLQAINLEHFKKFIYE